MTSAERFAIKLLVDRAKRAQLVGHGVHRTRLHGGSVLEGHSPSSTLTVRPVRLPRNERGWNDSRVR